MPKRRNWNRLVMPALQRQKIMPSSSWPLMDLNIRYGLHLTYRLKSITRATRLFPAPALFPLRPVMRPAPRRYPKAFPPGTIPVPDLDFPFTLDSHFHLTDPLICIASAHAVVRCPGHKPGRILAPAMLGSGQIIHFDGRYSRQTWHLHTSPAHRIGILGGIPCKDSSVLHPVSRRAHLLQHVSLPLRRFIAHPIQISQIVSSA